VIELENKAIWYHFGALKAIWWTGSALNTGYSSLPYKKNKNKK
jgi:hypothetical protein